MRRFGLLVFGLALSGCASGGNGPVFTEPPPPPSGKVLVYIYRDFNAAFSVRNAAFYIDDKKFADLLPTDYSYVYVTPGHHLLREHWPYWPGDLALMFQNVEVPLEAKPGETYYYRLSTGVGGAGAGLTVEWNLQQVPADQARSELAGKHLAPADPKMKDGF